MHELKAGKAKASAKIGQTLFNRAIGGETAALIWWTKSQMGWKEKRELDISNPDGTLKPPTAINIVPVDVPASE